MAKAVQKRGPSKADLELADAVSEYYADPLGFVRFAFEWGKPGTSLAAYSGPDEWQEQFLADLGAEVQARGFDGKHAVKPIRFATSSGHGIGKSTIVAWLVCWILSTRPGAQGTVTANTFTQLETKTWAAIQRWMKLCITGHWFDITSDAIKRTTDRESWFCTAQTCKEENSEAFAGQHSAGSTSFYIFDEASAIPDKIFEVAEGGLTDGEPMVFLFGNPTKNSGQFYRAVFGMDRDRWNNRTIDSRSSALTNKEQFEEWIKVYGEDSDFVRVRVKGLAPRASDVQFIDSERVYEAQRRQAHFLPDDPLVIGVDIARGGSDNNVIWFRRGNDARSIPPIRIPGEQTRDSSLMVAKIAEVLGSSYGGVHPAVAFIDGTGVGGPIVDQLKRLGHRNVVEVQFGGRSPNPKCANMRAYMWDRMKEWLIRGSIPSDPRLETDLTAPGFRHDSSDKIVLEAKEKMKDRGVDSPDDADALALTFARVTGPATPQLTDRQMLTRDAAEWGGYGVVGWMG